MEIELRIYRPVEGRPDVQLVYHVPRVADMMAAELAAESGERVNVIQSLCCSCLERIDGVKARGVPVVWDPAAPLEERLLLVARLPGLWVAGLHNRLTSQADVDDEEE